jgi:hypothetical protein
MKYKKYKPKNKFQKKMQQKKIKKHFEKIKKIAKKSNDVSEIKPGSWFLVSECPWPVSTQNS